ncbi:hypothetical protein [Dongia deserti]|uniref:hypothetical protein n=1 Tax=Dongia deserti TaxID=2268030 RepID=UPI000E64A106|nr:hypothetical protein [Dongia deserti]
MRHAASLAAFLALIALPALADPIVDEKSTTETSITMDDKAYLIHTINRWHDVTSFYDDRTGTGEMKRYLVESEIERLSREADEEEIDIQSSVLRIKARPLTPRGLGEAMTMETKADEVAVSGPYVIATLWGCCVEQPSHEVFSLYTGKRLFSATGEGESGDWLTMGKKAPNYDQRIVAAHIAFTARDADELSEDRDVVGLITYATEAEPLQRLTLRAPGGRDSDLPLEWTSKLLWLTKREPEGIDHAFFEQVGVAQEVYTGITLRLRLDDQTNIDIPLVADRLVPGEAKLPDGYALTEVAVE